MATENPFVAAALDAAQRILAPPLSVVRGAPLLYQVTVSNSLELTVDPAHPTRGASAFQTDLCVFETKPGDVKIPRVVLEFKGHITTHDVLTYSAKARKHKQVYPYLRYGVVMSEELRVPGRVFTHNEALDFALALRDFKSTRLHELLASTIQAEVAACDLLAGSCPRRNRNGWTPKVVRPGRNHHIASSRWTANRRMAKACEI